MQMLSAQALESLTSARDLVEWGAARFTEHGLFFGHGTDNAHDEAVVLVLNALGLEFDVPMERLDEALSKKQKTAVVELLTTRIAQRKPAPYLTGEAWFAGLRFFVDERVLIPRSPIAEWVERGFSPWIEPPRVRRLLDIGTGSGCIAIAAAKAFPQAEIVAVDVSEEALEVAEENISRHALEERIRIVCSDLFDAVTERFDVIVSNPPYVDGEELASMPEEFHHEPLRGLSGGSDGLVLVREILSGAHSYLERRWSPDR